MKTSYNKNAQALILVLTILAVVSVIGFSFMYMTQVQMRGANTYMAKLQTKYLAEAGINHAKGVIEFDKSDVAIDSLADLWHTAFQGTDVDLDNDGVAESKWINVKDDQGNDVGRYAVLVSDEAAKVNINAADQSTLTQLFNNLDLGGQLIADGIMAYRYGLDRKPGEANKDDNDNNYSLENDSWDNDSDGVVDETNEGVDEPDEFKIEEPLGDDQPFLVKDELKNISGISNNDIDSVVRFVTVSAKDTEIDGQGDLRQNINYIKSENLLKVMLSKGVPTCWQKAANIIDYLDSNLARTTVYQHYNSLESVAAQFSGDWVWQNDQYECGMPGGRGTWTWQNLPFSDGEYYCFVYGWAEEAVGDVEINGAIQENVSGGSLFAMGEGHKVKVEDHKLSLTIQNNEGFGQTCYFSRIELIPQDLGSSSALNHKEFRGVEALRINEIMVKPKLEMDTTPASAPGGYWVWQGSLFVNAQPESGQEGEGTWIFTNIPNGNYYLRLLGEEGEFIGDVEVNGRTQLSLRHDDYFTALDTVSVSSNQIIIRVRNNFQDKTCYFKGIILSQQPDAEYVELINISDNAVDLSGWMLETTGQEAVTAYIPQGTIINSYGYVVLCVDKDDQAQGIENNDISFKDTWSGLSSVQLDFFKTLDRDFDFLNDSPVAGENYLILKDAKGKVVDKVEYLNGQIVKYIALERADPTDQSDSNNNSEFDNWFSSIDLSGGTPGKVNDNSGMDKDQFSNHDVTEVNVRNNPVSNVLDLTGVSQSYEWSKISLEDISLIIDSLTVFGTTLYSKDSNLSGWTQISSGQGGYFSNTSNEVGSWRWEKLDNGSYFVTIKGESDEAITVSYKKADGSWQTLTQGALPNEEDLVYCGFVSIGEGGLATTPDNTLEIQIVNASSTGIAHFFYIRLDPLSSVYNRININTAPSEVLLSLPNMDSATVDKIINERPLGNKDVIYKGIGDLFLTDIWQGEANRINKFKSFSNLITVRSNVFEVTSRAQVLDKGAVVATQEIKTVIERQ